MHNPWLNEFSRTCILVAIFGIGGALLDNVLMGITVGLVVSLVLLYRRLYTFFHWFNQNRFGNHPQDRGVIENLYYRSLYLQSRHDKQRKNMERIMKRFQESARAMPDAVIVLNQRNETEWSNKAARQLIGLKRKKDNGQIISNLIRHPEFIHYLMRADFKYPIEFPSPTNEDIRLQAQIIPYGKDSRLLVIRDITQIHSLEKMRRDFIASASHELRTPLTVITGYLEALQDITNNETREIVDTMLIQAQRMESIIKDTLMLARLESLQNHKEHGRKPIIIKDLIDNIYADAQAIGGWTHDIQLDIDPTINISGNETELHSVASNLIQNAVRYTPPGTTIKVSWEPWKDAARLIVEDNGPGIPSQHLSRLTERFYRVDTGRSRDKGGTGLGLAIVDQIIRHHEGQLHVDSTEGKGTRFICEFPAHLVIHQNSPQLRIVGH